jgi:hypothetical protein
MGQWIENVRNSNLTPPIPPLEDMKDEVVPLIAEFLARTDGSAPCPIP